MWSPASICLFQYVHFCVLVAWLAHSLSIVLLALFIVTYRSHRARNLSSRVNVLFLITPTLTVCFITWLAHFSSISVLNIYYVSLLNTLHEKCPNTELFLVRIFLYSVQIQENADSKKLRIWTLSTQ